MTRQRFKTGVLLLRLILSLLATALFLSASPAQPPQKQNFLTRLGLALMEASKYQSISLSRRPFTRSLPASVDLSVDMPPVGYQGQQDSCTAWSTVYVVRTYLEHAELQHWDVRSPTAEFSPAFLYNQFARGNCNASVTIPDALNLLSAQGAATLDVMPYVEADCGQQPSPQTVQQAEQYRINGYRRLNPQNLIDVKAHLAARLPVVVALDVDNAFMTLGRNQVWLTKGASVGSHAAVLVGYNDAQHVFKLINSWGTSWGTDGYGYIDYNMLPTAAREAYIILPFHSHDNPNQAREVNVQLLKLDVAPSTIPGLNAQIEYTLRGYSGHTGMIVLYFWYLNGQPVGAAIPQYADITGSAAVATPLFTIPKNDYSNYVFTQFIPTSALNVPMGANVVSGGKVMYQPQLTPLLVRADLYVDNYSLAQSQYFTFPVSR